MPSHQPNSLHEAKQCIEDKLKEVDELIKHITLTQKKLDHFIIMKHKLTPQYLLLENKFKEYRNRKKLLESVKKQLAELEPCQHCNAHYQHESEHFAEIFRRLPRNIQKVLKESIEDKPVSSFGLVIKAIVNH